MSQRQTTRTITQTDEAIATLKPTEDYPWRSHQPNTGSTTEAA
ncbi:hypothetical protein [Laspinema sp. D2d]|nr:hypothetical protein [Laspinema sp. D2d]